MLGNAAVEAARRARERWLETDDDPVIVTYEYHARETTPLDEETGESDPCITFGYAAQAVEVEVDVETGRLYVVRVVSAHDIGRAINPQQVEGQIEGGMVQGQGVCDHRGLHRAKWRDSDAEPLDISDSHSPRYTG